MARMSNTKNMSVLVRKKGMALTFSWLNEAWYTLVGPQLRIEDYLVSHFLPPQAICCPGPETGHTSALWTGSTGWDTSPLFYFLDPQNVSIKYFKYPQMGGINSNFNTSKLIQTTIRANNHYQCMLGSMKEEICLGIFG